MPDYELIFLLHPPGVFGLPEEGKTVYPGAETADFVGPTMDTLTGNLVNHGTLSKYRDQPLTREFTVAGAKLSIRDNYIYLHIESADDYKAVELGIGIVNRFCALLSVYNSYYCAAEIIQGTIDQVTERRRVLLPKMVSLMSLTAYNLELLGQQIDAATSAYAVSDPRLDKAVAYFYHALLMSNERARITNFLSFHSKLIISEVILNYYKAVSTIIGEAGTDKGYQSRYKRFGIPHQLWSDAERLRQLRNTYDIAHYTPDLKALESVDSHQGFAHTTAQQTIKAYVQCWRSKRDRHPHLRSVPRELKKCRLMPFCPPRAY